MRRRFENNAKLYEYKIVSNCIGGGVIVEGKKVGTIPHSGQFIFLSKKERLDSISIQGGVPSNQRLFNDSYTENKTEIEGIEDLKLNVLPSSSNPRLLDVNWVNGPLYRVSTPITYNTYTVYEYRAPSDINNVQPGEHYLNYIRTLREETMEIPGAAVKDQLVLYDSTWHLNIVGGNVEHMGQSGQSGILYKINTVAQVGISSPIQINSYIVLEGKLYLRLTVVTTGEKLDEIPITQQVRYEFK